MTAVADPLLLDLPSSFESERLLLRVPQAGDGPVFLEALTESLPELRRFLAFLSWVGGELSPEGAESHVRKTQANFVARTDFTFLLFHKASRALVGACGLHRPVWTVPQVEIGYWGRTRFGGQGFVAEGVQAMTSFAFERLGAQRVELVTDEANTASRRVAERGGFTLEGVKRNATRGTSGELGNLCLYSRLPGDLAKR
jgi:RimJ/RimL family protein N-acetyltransferase